MISRPNPRLLCWFGVLEVMRTIGGSAGLVTLVLLGVHHCLAFYVSPLVGSTRGCRRSGSRVDRSRQSRYRGLDLAMGDAGGETYLHKAIVTALAVVQVALTGPNALSDVAQHSHPLPLLGLEPAIAFNLVEEAGTSNAKTQTSAANRGPFLEAWEFCDKFYVDRSFKGNDWKEVRDRLLADIAAGRKNERRATEEMLGLLKDKYTRLISPETYDSLSKYDMVGVGVMLSPNSDGQLAVASAPKAKSEAASLGMKKGDLITGINGMSTEKMSSFDVIDFLAKYQGSKIKFTVRDPASSSETREMELTRTFLKVENPVQYLVKDQGKHKVGYAKVKEFNAVTTDRLREALGDMKRQGADEFVLDLRGNGGGAFQSALGIAGLFMNDKLITYVMDGDGQRIGFSTKTESVVSTEPLVVWIDGRSASASEVLAGALHDDCRALLRGDRTFGKGLIQAVYGLSDSSGLILTVAQYVTPRGTNIQGTGISPDVEGGLPPKLLGLPGDIDQGQFNMARERMEACPPIDPKPVASTGALSI